MSRKFPMMWVLGLGGPRRVAAEIKPIEPFGSFQRRSRPWTIRIFSGSLKPMNVAIIGPVIVGTSSRSPGGLRWGVQMFAV